MELTSVVEVGRITIQQTEDEAAESRGHYSDISLKADTDRSPGVLKDKCSLLIIYRHHLGHLPEQTALRSLIYATLHYLSKRQRSTALTAVRLVLLTASMDSGEARHVVYLRKIHAKSQIKTTVLCQHVQAHSKQTEQEMSWPKLKCRCKMT